MKALRWIDKRLLVILHDESLAEHGGASTATSASPSLRWACSWR